MEKPSGIKGILFFLVFICILMGLYGCGWIKNYKSDNFIEESAEAIFKEYSGVEVDFTPNSPEKKM